MQIYFNKERQERTGVFEVMNLLWTDDRLWCQTGSSNLKLTCPQSLDSVWASGGNEGSGWRLCGMVELFHDGIDDTDEDDRCLRLKLWWGGGGLNCRSANLTAVLEERKSAFNQWPLKVPAVTGGNAGQSPSLNFHWPSFFSLSRWLDLNRDISRDSLGPRRNGPAPLTPTTNYQ